MEELAGELIEPDLETGIRFYSQDSLADGASEWGLDGVCLLLFVFIRQQQPDTGCWIATAIPISEEGLSFRELTVPKRK